ncbi:MAG TPA: ABC transporter substrate-binding protein [Streptosporangiaceae bacterium]|nr:ABC transporter substrate-binding protein [Streptosporangiaceae bacterium]
MRPHAAANSLHSWRQASSAKILLAAGAGIAMLLAAGCSSGGGAGTAVSGTIKIAAEPGIADAPLWIAAEKGLFTAEGLHVEIVTYGSESAALNAVETGQAQIAASDYGNIFGLEQQDSNLRILADGYDTGTGNAEILTLPQANFTNPLKLQDPTTGAIGLPSDSDIDATLPSGAPTSLLAAAATKVISNYLAGDANTLTWHAMSQQQELAQLQDGKLKAALLTEPYVYEAESEFGASELIDVFSGETANLPLLGYVATTSWVRNDAAAVDDFQAAIYKAQADASMTGPIQQVLPKLPGSGINTETADMVSIGTYPTSTSTAALQRVTELMYTETMLPRVTAQEGFVTGMLANSNG